ncbi:hypothetical protein CCR85_02885 [Rhodothalassium salexigens]|uniref:class I SAM-dependent methyltransferase n=1 Tax=Rhodothalassium salexigens TaxID=1086 RepID=UPI001913FE5E|nr:class I SAM-dependent methyltransferase [Rhodothalassium salexigens]MBK5910436.1 hypothetical protein [Rhodothalassium salexigens]MBK5921746.1 hypothetical protein [Rhodothalassium salexigens]
MLAVFRSVARLGAAALYRTLDPVYRALDRHYVVRTPALRRIPGAADRRGGKHAYGEWAHVAGLFQGLIHQALGGGAGHRVLDVGCGTGLLGIAASPYVATGGCYTGLDVQAADIAAARRRFAEHSHRFVHLAAANPAYDTAGAPARPPWPVDDASQDLVTALSVWTHFAEADAGFYLREVARVLRPGGRALITAFVLDDLYRAAAPTRLGRWVFDRPAYGADDWLCPAWVRVPEDAVALTDRALDRIATAAGLALTAAHAGTWKAEGGLYFQDVLMLEKPASGA